MTKENNSSRECVRLPTLKNLARDVEKLSNRVVSEGIRAKVPFISLSPQRIVHEGDATHLTRADGSQDESKLKSHVTMKETNVRDHLHFDINNYREELNDMVEDFSKSISHSFIEKLTDVSEETGQIVDGSNRRFQESMLDVLEMIPASEEEDGGPVMLVSPEMGRKISVLAEQPVDSDIQERLDDINEQKRYERIARKASRKLVG